MGQVAKNPVICGRKICNECGIWRHAVDFRWRWRNPEFTRGYVIDGICRTCYRERERQRYARLSNDEKSDYIRMNTRARTRRDRMTRIQLAAVRKDLAKMYQAGYVDIVPFRMWLLLKARTNGGPAILAKRSGVTQTRIKEWLEGCSWTGHYCEPTPIRSVALRTVEDVTTRLGEPQTAALLYPLEY